MNKILLLSQAQFGSLVDYYQYTILLKSRFLIHYVCWDYNRVKIEFEGVKVHYISRKGNIFKRNIRFIYQSYKIIKLNNFDRILIHYFRGCSVLRFFLMNNSNVFLDIRTASVARTKFTRVLMDYFLLSESIFFRRISVISEGVKKRLKLSRCSVIIPLGANEMNPPFNKRNGIHLIYIGTLSNRNIDQTIDGLKHFISNKPNVSVSYKIVGTGDAVGMSKIRECISYNNLENVVELIGYVPHYELIEHVKDANIGVSYVPITEYFHFQPVTKTYEYLMAGLPVIATSTFENQKIIDEKNGILIEDNAFAFSAALSKIINLMDTYNSSFIRERMTEHKWEKIVLQLEKHLLLENRSKN